MVNLHLTIRGGPPACDWRPRIARAIQPDCGPIADVHSASITFGHIRQVKSGFIQSKEVEWLLTKTRTICSNRTASRLIKIMGRELRHLSPEFTGAWAVIARSVLHQGTLCPRKATTRIQRRKDQFAGALSSTPTITLSEHQETKSDESRTSHLIRYDP
jgi:hypothetical protein